MHRHTHTDRSTDTLTDAKQVRVSEGLSGSQS